MSHHPSPHDARAAFLANLAMASGCATRMGTLPDGCRPDVLNASLARGILFVGDAKDTETPGCVATRARLRRYFRWVRAHVANGGTAIVAICYGRRRDGAGWVSTMAELSAEAGLALQAADSFRFGDDCAVVRVVIRPATLLRA